MSELSNPIIKWVNYQTPYIQGVLKHLLHFTHRASLWMSPPWVASSTSSMWLTEWVGQPLLKREFWIFPGKAACDRMAADCGFELKKRGVSMVSLWPGPVKTEYIQVQCDNCRQRLIEECIPSVWMLSYKLSGQDAERRNWKSNEGSFWERWNSWVF